MDVTVERTDDVVVARWRDGENRVNADSVAALSTMLDEVEHMDGNIALVVTGEGKFFSNGLDLDRLSSDAAELGRTASGFQRLLGRLLVFPVYTVAAINGHAFAAGAMLTCAFDHRVMREDRGYWCLNEVEIGLPLTEQMAAIVLARLPHATALEAMLTARRYDASGAIAAGIVEEAASTASLESTAVARAALVASKHRSIVAAHKRLAFAGVARACGFDG